MIEVRELTKHFRVHRREPGLRAALRSLVRREHHTVRAVDQVSFTIPEGEMVGFLGPNGAGKTTTLKCLTGLLHPTAGTVRVLGHVPHHREPAFLRRISLVMGQRNALFWDLPAADAFEVNRAIYGLAPAPYRSALDELVVLLGLEPLLGKQVRVLSLGERMRCELAGALLHRPDVVFLDEPTLGLDVNGQAAVRAFLRDYNARHGATILLTSHYMGDVTALARRVLVIDRATLRFDGDLTALVEAHSPHRLVRVTLREAVPARTWTGLGEVSDVDGAVVTLMVPRTETAAIAARLLTTLPVEDVAIEDPPVEDIIRAVFADA
ncbi:ATP-binding cassette domain-containing protein [Dactylosporangium aurantiacum]|uniref:ATP-binding cassette domain-containing protein n=1 Tax=Dactylosporangium aurantiacum TaxID=35754 RepID=A0A9Q9MJB9_9ACTN|nr:ATP-binding cassette domain-containing protein [Dactylosporangium aurantiacum]MDG6103968.1 ATP-binding cassette domain-containing protein [Dactylosporangium aurantiacum]UWZ58854.1 ATP-binding cassette domain-containing protein [Dactylosporangium aurantiacum]